MAKVVSQSEILELMAQTPDIQENQMVLNQLEMLANELSVVKENFTYSNQIVAAAGGNGIAAGGTPPAVNTLIDASAMFVIVSQTYDANTANAAVTVNTRVSPNITVFISDTGSAKPWSDIAVTVPAWFGVGTLPFFLPERRLVPGNSQIQVTYVNFDPAAGYNIRLYFHGYKMYSTTRRTLG